MLVKNPVVVSHVLLYYCIFIKISVRVSYICSVSIVTCICLLMSNLNVAYKTAKSNNVKNHKCPTGVDIFVYNDKY